MPTTKPIALFVVRAARGSPEAGDRVHVRRMIPFLERHFDLRVVTLENGGIGNRLRDFARIWPIEMTGYFSEDNRKRLAEALQLKPSYVYLIHESIFAFAGQAADSGAVPVLFSMNSISQLMETDASLWQRWLGPIARRYEARYFQHPAATLTVVSRLDARWLRKGLGVDRRFPVVPPGILPPIDLRDDAVVAPELVITGSYAWWRKRRDLKYFRTISPRFPIWIKDDVAANILGERAHRLPDDGFDWGGALRFGLITDRFLGGFKLKSLEYVGVNCIVLTSCDLRDEFAGLPYVEEFIVPIRSGEDIGSAIEVFRQQPPSKTVARFRRFQAACAERFDWERCLAPLAPPFKPDPAFDDL